MRIHATNLGLIRGGRLVFSHLDLHVAAGAALVLTGPNGAGKSSLLRVLAGLLRPDSGTIEVGGHDAFADLAGHAGRIAFLGHLDAIKPGLTPPENLRFQAASAGRGPADIAAALDAMGLSAQAGLASRLLSAGQRRRLALARIWLAERPVLLLDEPGNGLDTASLARLGALLARHRERGGAVVVSTHTALPLPDASTLALG